MFANITSENKYDENESDNKSDNASDESLSGTVYSLTLCDLIDIEKIREYSISHGYADNYTAEHYAIVMAFKPYILYIIEDDNYDKYVDVHLYDKNKSLEENLNHCMQQHLNENVNNNKKSLVLRMVNPLIKSFNGDIKDENPVLLYGHTECVLELKDEYVKNVRNNCKKDGTKLLNILDTNKRHVIIVKPLKKINVIDREIKRLDKKIVIETEPHPTQKNPNRITYVIKNQSLCNHLGRQGRRIRSVDKKTLLQLKIESIAEMCMVSLDKVNKVLHLDIKPSPEYLENQKQKQKRLLEQQKEERKRKREERKRKERYKAEKEGLDKILHDLKYGSPEQKKKILQRIML